MKLLWIQKKLKLSGQILFWYKMIQFLHFQGKNENLHHSAESLTP